MDSMNIITIFIFIIVAIVGNFLIIKDGQHKIRDDAEQKELTIQMIRWDPFHIVYIFGGRRGQFYNVEYHDRTGTLHTTTGETRLLSGVKWDV